MKKALIIARYKEDTNWMKQTPDGWKKYVIEKGFHMPNYGREPLSYLWWIKHHYDNLPDTMVFVQGNPFDHVPDLLDKLGVLDIKGFEWLGKDTFVCDQKGRSHDSLPMMPWVWGEVFNCPMPEKFTFKRGCHFAVTKDVIVSRPYWWYEKLYQIIEHDEKSAWVYERIWNHLFEKPLDDMNIEHDIKTK